MKNIPVKGNRHRPTDMKVSDGEVEMEIGEPLEVPPPRTPKGTARSLTSSVRGEEI